MPALLENTECTVCTNHHNFTLLTGHLEPGRRYDYVCPVVGSKASLSPTSAGEQTHFAPQGAIALVPAVDRAEPHPTAKQSTDETTRLQNVLPKVMELAGKVGGMDNLSDLVDTLKESKE